MTKRANSLGSRASVFTLALTAFFGLTGGKGGCGGHVEVIPEPPVLPCGPGFHLEQECVSSGTGCATTDAQEPGDCAPIAEKPSCTPMCVPDECPAGSELKKVCKEVPSQPPCPPDSNCADVEGTTTTTGGGYLPPVVEQCHYQCVPSYCPKGTHKERVCDMPLYDCAPDTDCIEPDPVCHDECVPDHDCGKLPPPKPLPAPAPEQQHHP
jgi:hypothetical protein